MSRFPLLGVFLLSLTLAMMPASGAWALRFDVATGSPLKEADATWGPVSNLTVGDFNGDGRDDVARVGQASAVIVYLAQANGTFSAGSKYATSIGDNSIVNRGSIYSGDFNGDGKVDLLLTGKASPNSTDPDPIRWEVYAGSGSGAFGASPSSQGVLAATGTLAGKNSSELADVNGDGRPDLVSGLTNHRFAVALGTGTGAFNPVAGSPFNVPTPSGADAMAAVAVGNFTGTSAVDVALLMRNGNASAVYLATGNGSGAFTASATPVYSAASTPVTSIAGIDLDGDAYRDLTLTQPNRSSGQDMWSMLGGAAGLQPNTSAGNQVDPGFDPVSQHVHDMNADGRPDVVVGLAGGKGAAVILADGTGGMAPARYSPYGMPGVDIATSYVVERVLTGDFNGDGFVDLAGLMADDNVYNQGIDVLLSSPSPSVSTNFVEFPAVAPGSSSSPVEVTLANDPGAPPVKISGFDIPTDGDQYRLDSSACGTTLTGGASCTIKVTFAPQGEGVFNTTLAVHFANAADLIVGLDATTGTPYAIVSPSGPVDFETAVIGYPASQSVQTFTVTAGGGRDLELNGASISGPDAASFQLVDPAACVTSLAPGTSCQLSVKFAPTGTAPIVETDATLTVNALNDIFGPNPVQLYASFALATHEITPTAQAFGSVVLGSGGVSKTFRIRPQGERDVLPVERVSISGPEAGSFRITSAPCARYATFYAPCVVTVRFAPVSGSPGPRTARLDFGVFTTTDAPTSVALSGNATPVPITTPSISRIRPASGALTGGTKVTIDGTGLTRVNNVMFGAVPAKSFTVVSPTQITATSPRGHDLGAVHVRVGNRAGTSAVSARDRFTYKATPTIKITKVSSVKGHAVLTITVAAKGVPASARSGKLTVSHGSQTLGRGTVRSGKVTIRLKALAKNGRLRLTLSYTGSSRVAAATKRISVKVPGRVR